MHRFESIRCCPGGRVSGDTGGARRWGADALRRAAQHPLLALGAALLVTVLVGAIDYATGYELRLATLYLVPICIATWAGGGPAGSSIVAVSALFWLLSFGSTHPYSVDFYFYWEGVVMVAVQAAFVLLLTRLRTALANADERFSRVLEELYSAVYVADPDSGQILYANASLARLTGVDPLTLDIDALGERLGLDGDCMPPFVPASAAFVSREARHVASGRWYLLRVGLIPWKAGQRARLHMITDISEQKRVQLLKRQHQDMLHKNERLATLAEIASSLAHEINQPLMAIASYNDACLRMLDAPTLPRDDLATALRRCREQALRAGNIIGRVREFIRSKRPSPVVCEVNTLIREAIELLETQIADGAITLRLALLAEPLSIRADPTLLVQVMVNLLQNAIDAMATCPLARRTLSVFSARSDDGAIVVTVADQGGGVAATIADQLFTPFQTTKAQGLGLGLSICRSVVEAHGGWIWYSANADGGSSFHFTLPAQVE